MSELFTPKQRQLLHLWKTGGLCRINLLEGSVRSGKTWISLVLWAFWVASMPKGEHYLMVAKTLTSLRRNCLDLLQDLIGPRHFTFSLARKEALLFGHVVYLEGVSDSRAESKIRGMTLQGAYCDELTLFTEDFFTMLLSRLSAPGAKLFGTTNPDSPSHWLKTGYIDRANELDMLIVPFLLEDNTFLDPAYVESLKKEYVGVFYDRFILGLWKNADGLIYRQFADNPTHWLVDQVKPHHIDFISIGVDFGGNRSLTTFVATAILRGFSGLVVLKDAHLGGQKGEIDADRVAHEFLRFLRELQADYPGVFLRFAFADNEAQYLIATLRKACFQAGFSLKVGDCAKVPIVQRIACTNTLLATDRLHLLKNCSLVRAGLTAAIWDSKAAALGKDIRLDDFTSDIDILDAFEYSFSRFLKKLTPG